MEIKLPGQDYNEYCIGFSVLLHSFNINLLYVILFHVCMHAKSWAYL